MVEPYDGPAIYDDKGFHLFGRDDETATRVWCKYQDGGLVFRVDQEVSAIVDANTALRNETQAKGFGEWVRVASVPVTMLEKSGLAEAKANHDDRFIRRWLNDGDNRAFRTHEGTF